MQRSALRLSQRRSVNANRVALVPEATEEGVDERFVAEKGLPFGKVQIGRDQCRLSAIALLHQLEEDVGLLWPEIDVPQLVNQQTIDFDQRVEELARRPIRQRGVEVVEEILRANEATAIPVLNRLQQQAGGNSGLTHPRLAD